MEYGEVDLKTMVIGDFEGDLDPATSFFNRLMGSAVGAAHKEKVYDPK